MGILRNIFIWSSENDRLTDLLPRYAFIRKAVLRFIPGEDLESALSAAEIIYSHGIHTVLTYLGENVTQQVEADQNSRHYHDVLKRVSERGLTCHISVKLTQLGLNLDTDLWLSNLRSLVEHTSKLGNFIWIDMESSDYVDSTLEIFHRLRSEFSNIGICLQSYLYRTFEDLERLLPLSPAIRLVKGAYAEPRDIAYKKKKVVDENFLKQAIYLLREAQRTGIWPAFATHDPKLIRQIQGEAAGMGIPKKALEFQMLYGIRRDEQIRLVRDGYRLRILISYGSAWFPWYMRRLAERPANLFFVLKNFFI